MSRVGLKPISLPDKVEVDIRGSNVTVKGPKGQLDRSFNPDMEIALADGMLRVSRPTDHRTHRALHGLTRALLANMVTGVSRGFSKSLEIVGISPVEFGGTGRAGEQVEIKGNAGECQYTAQQDLRQRDAIYDDRVDDDGNNQGEYRDETQIG